MSDYLKPIILSDGLWCYADDKRLEIVVSGAAIYQLTWKRLDRLRKQAAAARSKGKYKP